MFCAGYPSVENPQKGIFSHRSAKVMAERFDVEIVLLRSFNFQRPPIVRYSYEGMPVIQLSIPQLPHREQGRLMAFNSRLLSWGIRLLLGRNFLKQAVAFHSTMLIPTSMAVQPLADKLGILHIGQSIGDDVNLYLSKVRTIPGMLRRLKRIDYIQCNSQALEDTLIEYLPEVSERTFVLHRGVDTTLFSPSQKETDQGVLKVLFLGGVQTCSPELYETLNTKGAHVLMEGWKIFEKQKNDVKLTFGGPGASLHCVQSWKNELDSPSNVDIIDSVSPSDVPTLLNAHDVVVIPSLYEGLPNLANESQSAGVPVVAANVGGVPESVVDRETGLLFTRGDSAGLADCLERMYSDSDLRNRLGVNGRDRMLKEFSWTNFADTLQRKICSDQ